MPADTTGGGGSGGSTRGTPSSSPSTATGKSVAIEPVVPAEIIVGNTNNSKKALSSSALEIKNTSEEIADRSTNRVLSAKNIISDRAFLIGMFDFFPLYESEGNTPAGDLFDLRVSLRSSDLDSTKEALEQVKSESEGAYNAALTQYESALASSYSEVSFLKLFYLMRKYAEQSTSFSDFMTSYSFPEASLSLDGYCAGEGNIIERFFWSIMGYNHQVSIDYCTSYPAIPSNYAKIGIFPLLQLITGLSFGSAICNRFILTNDDDDTMRSIDMNQDRDAWGSVDYEPQYGVWAMINPWTNTDDYGYQCLSSDPAYDAVPLIPWMSKILTISRQFALMNAGESGIDEELIAHLKELMGESYFTATKDQKGVSIFTEAFGWDPWSSARRAISQAWSNTQNTQYTLNSRLNTSVGLLGTLSNINSRATGQRAIVYTEETDFDAATSIDTEHGNTSFPSSTSYYSIQGVVDKAFEEDSLLDFTEYKAAVETMSKSCQTNAQLFKSLFRLLDKKNILDSEIPAGWPLLENQQPLSSVSLYMRCLEVLSRRFLNRAGSTSADVSASSEAKDGNSTHLQYLQTMAYIYAANEEKFIYLAEGVVEDYFDGFLTAESIPEEDEETGETPDTVFINPISEATVENSGSTRLLNKLYQLANRVVDGGEDLGDIEELPATDMDTISAWESGDLTGLSADQIAAGEALDAMGRDDTSSSAFGEAMSTILGENFDYVVGMTGTVDSTIPTAMIALGGEYDANNGEVVCSTTEHFTDVVASGGELDTDSGLAIAHRYGDYRQASYLFVYNNTSGKRSMRYIKTIAGEFIDAVFEVLRVIVESVEEVEVDDSRAVFPYLSDIKSPYAKGNSWSWDESFYSGYGFKYWVPTLEKFIELFCRTGDYSTIYCGRPVKEIIRNISRTLISIIKDMNIYDTDTKSFTLKWYPVQTSLTSTVSSIGEETAYCFYINQPPTIGGNAALGWGTQWTEDSINQLLSFSESDIVEAFNSNGGSLDGWSNTYGTASNPLGPAKADVLGRLYRYLVDEEALGTGFDIIEKYGDRVEVYSTAALSSLGGDDDGEETPMSQFVTALMAAGDGGQDILQNVTPQQLALKTVSLERQQGNADEGYIPTISTISDNEMIALKTLMQESSLVGSEGENVRLFAIGVPTGMFERMSMIEETEDVTRTTFAICANLVDIEYSDIVFKPKYFKFDKDLYLIPEDFENLTETSYGSLAELHRDMQYSRVAFTVDTGDDPGAEISVEETNVKESPGGESGSHGVSCQINLLVSYLFEQYYRLMVGLEINEDTFTSTGDKLGLQINDYAADLSTALSDLYSALDSDAGDLSTLFSVTENMSSGYEDLLSNFSTEIEAGEFSELDAEMLAQFRNTLSSRLFSAEAMRDRILSAKIFERVIFLPIDPDEFLIETEFSAGGTSLPYTDPGILSQYIEKGIVEEVFIGSGENYKLAPRSSSEGEMSFNKIWFNITSEPGSHGSASESGDISGQGNADDWREEFSEWLDSLSAGWW